MSDKNKNNKGCLIFLIYILAGIMILSLFFFFIPQNIKEYRNSKIEKNLQSIKDNINPHNTFVKGPNMNYFHNGPAVLLNDGNVLVIGGDTQKAEIFDYKKNKFDIVGEMNYIRQYGATASLLKNGNVLIIGGARNWNIPKQTEIYNIYTKQFELHSNMCIPRVNHAAIVMNDGNILIFGGYDNNHKYVFEIEKYNYREQKFEIINTLPNDKCTYYTAIPIEENKILIIGISYPIKHTEFNNPKKLLVFDYKTNKLSNFEEKNIQPTDTKIFHTNIGLGTQIKDIERKNLIIIVNYKNNYVTDIKVKASKNIYTDYTIEDIGEQLIIIGGQLLYGWGVKFPDYTEIFDKESQQFYRNNKSLIYKRYDHTSIQLQNKNILILGGYSAKEPILKTELYIK